jgi:hypothetical protein
VSDEVTGFFQFIHSLLEPVLGWHYVLEVWPLLDDDRGKLAEVYKAEQI